MCAFPILKVTACAQEADPRPARLLRLHWMLVGFLGALLLHFPRNPVLNLFLSALVFNSLTSWLCSSGLTVEEAAAVYEDAETKEEVMDREGALRSVALDFDKLSKAGSIAHKEEA